MRMGGVGRSARRGLADFHVALQDPHRVYSPTDVVAGAVCVTVDRPVAITHLVVALVGRIDVYAPGTKKHTKERDYDGVARIGRGTDTGLTVCRDELVLCGEGRLEPGQQYQFRFELEFARTPDGGGGGLPSSLEVSGTRICVPGRSGSPACREGGLST